MMDPPVSNTTTPSQWSRFLSIRHFAPRAFGQALISIANFVQIQVAARLLKTEDFGLLSLILALNAGIYLAFFAPTCEGISRFLHQTIRDNQQDDLLRTIALAVGAAMAITLFGGVVFLVAQQLGMMKPMPIGKLLAAGAVAYFMAYGTAGVAASYFAVLRRYDYWLVFGFGIPAASAAVTWLTSRFTLPSPLLFIAAQCVISALLFLFVCGKRMQNGGLALQLIDRHLGIPPITFAFIGFVWPFPFLTLGRFLFTFSDRFAVAHFFSLKDVGSYGYMYTLTTTLVGAASTIYYAATYLRAVEQHAHAASASEAHAIVQRFTKISLLFPICFAPLLALYLPWDQRIATIVLGAHAVIPPHCLPLLLTASALYFGSEQLSLTGYLLHRVHIFLVIRWIFAVMLVASLLFFHATLYEVSLVMALANMVHFVAVLTTAMVISKKGPAPRHFEPVKS
jgi:O-antigen/teichoic acid export membrane protein